jgi:hypothetical protein
MTVARNSTLAGAIIGLAALAACTTGGQGPGGPAAAPDPAKGKWMSSDGVAVSSFDAGKFESRFAKTGELLTTGTYTYRDPRTIDLVFFSERTKRQDQATCFVGSAQLDCTNAAGTHFSLVRSA